MTFKTKFKIGQQVKFQSDSDGILNGEITEVNLQCSAKEKDVWYAIHANGGTHFIGEDQLLKHNA